MNKYQYERPIRIASILDVLAKHSHPELVAELEVYISELEAKRPPYLASGDYQHKWDYEIPPDTRTEIDWSQPESRHAPVWTHSVTCRYCNVTKEIETYRSNPPDHCGDEGCAGEHSRLLARARKKKQRARDKQRNIKRKHP